MRAFGTGDDRRSDYLTGSPCPQLDIPQSRLEPVLVDAAAAAGAVYRTATEYLSHEQDATGVLTRVRDRLTGTSYTIRSRYLVGADGARSTVLSDLGLPVDGRMGRATTVYTVFTADLTRHLSHRPSMVHWVLNPAVGYGEIGMGTLRAVTPWTEWIAGWGARSRDGPPGHPTRGGGTCHRRDDRRPGRGRDDPVDQHLAGQPGVGDRLLVGSGVLRRRRGAPASAQWRPRLQHLHPGRLQPGVEAVVRPQGLGRTGSAGVVHRRTRAGGTGRSSSGPTRPGWTTGRSESCSPSARSRTRRPRCSVGSATPVTRA